VCLAELRCEALGQPMTISYSLNQLHDLDVREGGKWRSRCGPTACACSRAGAAMKRRAGTASGADGRFMSAHGRSEALIPERAARRKCGERGGSARRHSDAFAPCLAKEALAARGGIVLLLVALVSS